MNIHALHKAVRKSIEEYGMNLRSIDDILLQWNDSTLECVRRGKYSAGIIALALRYESLSLAAADAERVLRSQLS